jgi:hypothetical protein
MTKMASPAHVLRRLYPWLGRAVHLKWSRKRSLYQEEAAALLVELAGVHGRVPSTLAFRLEGYLGRLHKEWFPRTWQERPTYAEVVSDFQWWLDIADRWSVQPAARNGRPKKPRSTEPVADQPAELLRALSLPRHCTQKRFMTAWRRFLKAHHPDLNPSQSEEERRRFKEAVALWKRTPARKPARAAQRWA